MGLLPSGQGSRCAWGNAVLEMILENKPDGSLRWNLLLKPTRARYVGISPSFLAKWISTSIVRKYTAGNSPPSGIPVTYFRCTACGFLFTRDFDAWSHADFGNRIYNAEYAFVDPDFAERRPAANASYVTHNFGIHRKEIRVLDYGGGEGRMMDLLRAEGFRSVNTYDPFRAG